MDLKLNMSLPLYLVITPFFPKHNSFRGPFVYDQVKAIEQTGNYSVVICKPKPWYSKEKDYEFEGVTVYRFSTFELPSNILPGLFNKLSSRSLIRKLKSIGMRSEDIAVVHAHVTSTGFLANALKMKSPKIKTVLQHHGFDVLSLTSGRLNKFRWHRNWVQRYGTYECNLIDLHIGVSAKTLEYLQAYTKIRIKDSYVLYNGVDTAKFFPIPGLKNPKYFTIGCIGNFWEIKDQVSLIKAAEKVIQEGIRNLRVIFIGSGELLQMCKDYVVKHALTENIEFRTEVHHHELCEFYNSLDLFVLPSWYEAFGCVYLEAYACGVPFIGIQGQGISEVIVNEDKQYFLSEPRHFEDLTEKIKSVYTYKDRHLHLNIPIDIKSLVSGFLLKLNT